MKVACVLLVCLALVCGQFCPEAPEEPEDRRVDKTRLRVATFNVEWLFLKEGNIWGTDAEIHMDNIANVIHEMDADIVVMPETQDCDVVQIMLENAILKDDGYKPYVIKGKDTATGQNVAVITRIDPIQDLERTENRANYPLPGNACNYAKTGHSGVSKHFYTTFFVPGLGNILLVGLHFLAFPTNSDRCAKREAQATVIREIVTQEGVNRGKHVIVLGDFNDYDSVFLDTAGSVPNSRVMEIIKGTELLNAGRYFTDRNRLYSSWYDINKNCIDDGGNERTTIDHILFSGTLKTKFKGMDYLNGLFTASCESITSDHHPIIVEFATPVMTDTDPIAQTATIDASSGSPHWIVAIVFVLALLGVLVVVAVVGALVIRKYRRNGFTTL